MVLSSWARHTAWHTASVRWPAGMADRMAHASRWSGEAMESERFSRRLSITISPRQLLSKPFVALGVQTYIVQDQRAAEAI